MSVNLYKIKKWTKMILGKSISHVNQGPGKIYRKNELMGYYNDLTEKVTKRQAFNGNVPTSIIDSGEEIFFAIEIFQYGLGAYDLFLQSDDKNMLDKAIKCAEWALDNQESNGGWICFAHENIEKPYSSMAQAEGISLLCRIYKTTKEKKFFDSATKAINFMIKPIEEGGTAEYNGSDIYLYEYTYSDLVLNGWIFSIWGLYDYWLLSRNNEIEITMNRTLKTLEKTISKFNCSYWSFYSLDKKMASPFYHKLHIAQLYVMYELTDENIFINYAKKWEKYNSNILYKSLAFINKAFQKIVE